MGRQLVLYHSRRAIHAHALTNSGFGTGSQIVPGHGQPGYFLSDTSHRRGTDHSVIAIDWDRSEQELEPYAYNRFRWPRTPLELGSGSLAQDRLAAR